MAGQTNDKVPRMQASTEQKSPVGEAAPAAMSSAVGQQGPALGALADHLPAELAQRLSHALAGIVGIDRDEVGYERYLREDVVELELFGPEDIDELTDAVVRVCAEGLEDECLLPALFVCFEWVHRTVFDATKRVARWRHLIRVAEPRLSGESLFCYMKSRCYLDEGDVDHAISAACDAHNAAPRHAGFLNNYAEMLLGVSEDHLLSPDSDALDDMLEASLRDALSSFDLIPKSDYHPIHYVTRGRIKSCLKRFKEANEDFSRAMQRENERQLEIQRRRGAAGLNMVDQSTYVTEMSEIVSAQSKNNVLANMEALRRSTETIRERQTGQADKLDRRLQALGERFDNERIDMLEFIGFFAGIISFVIASIQMGDGLMFPTRALMVVILLGALLIAFGCLSALLEAGRACERIDGGSVERRLRFVIGVGFLAIVVGMGMYLVIS